MAPNCLREASPPCRRRDVAGYLYGIAAECALKHIMQCSHHSRPSERVERKDDPLYAHFPALKTLLRDSAQGRYAGILRKFAEDDGFMNEWDIAMRYASRRDIEDSIVERWREHAIKAIAAMEDI